MEENGLIRYLSELYDGIKAGSSVFPTMRVQDITVRSLLTVNYLRSQKYKKNAKSKVCFAK